MKISFDPHKRRQTLEERGLDFDDAVQVFAGRTIEYEYDQRDYGETRFVTFGLLNDRMVSLVWTPRGSARHIISMRKANEREKKIYETELDRSG